MHGVRTTLSPALKQESEMKTHRHGVTCGLKTMRALRNAVSETTIVVQNPKTDADRVVSTTKRILSLSEAHKMQSAPNFSGKYVEDVGWTQVKTKHLSQLCQCGKSTRFYCICSTVEITFRMVRKKGVGCVEKKQNC
eukprot:CCRYP_004150-RA/>CCRYP_004150-RA protein AED:0.25 eAED:0.25 QI:2271/0.5/0.66/1/0/0.33/3/0/136